MKSSLKIFLLIEVLLGFFFVYSTLHSKLFSVLVVLALILFFLLWKGKRIDSRLLMIFCILTCILFFSNVYIWGMLLTAVLYFTVVVNNLNAFLFQNRSEHVDYCMVQTVEPSPKSNKIEKESLFGKSNYGQTAFEWDDIYIQKFVGDTIIDLASTILPKEENIVMTRVAFGRTRIFVPEGIGISLVHVGVFGNATFLGQTYPLMNEKMTFYSEDYDDVSRKVKIYTSNVFGTVEVTRV